MAVPINGVPGMAACVAYSAAKLSKPRHASIR
jgi:hypothetical protein